MLTENEMNRIAEEIEQTVEQLAQWKKIYQLLAEAELIGVAAIPKVEVAEWPVKQDEPGFMTVQNSKGYKICDNRDFHLQNGHTRTMLQLARAEDMAKTDTMLVWQDTREIYDPHYAGCLSCGVFPEILEIGR